MQTRNRNTFTTIHTEGALLPVDLLQRISENDKNLEGLNPESYHLAPGEKLNEAINRSWNRLSGLWGTFQAARGRLGSTDAGTTLTRERWLLPLFQELGFGRLSTSKAVEIEGKSYPISHRWQNVPLHLVGCGIELDKRTPGAAGASRTSPHSLIQEYLNRSDDVQWGVISNGLGLRILRDNATLTRQAYIEFDLESMFDGEIYSDFVLLWLMCHQSRFEITEKQAECLLEKWSKSAQESGTRALDDLRRGVEEAIVSFGQGFLQHPMNGELRIQLKNGDLPAQDYYRQLLRLVYRLIFLFAAEDRNLLLLPGAAVEARQRFQNYYSTTRLRALAQKQRGSRHHDRYEALRLVMNLLGSDSGCPELAIPALGGFLFDARSTADLNDAKLDNQTLLSAVRSLAFITEGNTRRAVDYRNLGPEELGSVYESLLELHPLLNTDAGTFQLTSAAGNERKTTGSYYTPTSLIQVLLDSALDPVIEDRLKGKQDAVQQEQALLELKVCDPACGSGHFLIAAAHRIAGRLAEVRAGENEPSPNETRPALRDVIRHCIYGVDINPMAVELCKVNLWLESIEPGKPLSFLDAHIKCGSSIVGLDFTYKLDELVVPDEAFNHIARNEKPIANLLKKRNKSEREGQESLFVMALDNNDDLEQEHWLAERSRSLNVMPDNNAIEVKAIEEAYQQVSESSQYCRQRQIADLWTSAFFWKVEAPLGRNLEVIAPTHGQLHRLLNGRQTQDGLNERVEKLRQEEGFFHWPIEFADVKSAGGFDCIVGNPPYIQLQTMHEKADMLQGFGFETFARTGDIYCLFYERGVQLLRKDGILAFITSNKWMRAGYGEALRKFFAENTNPLLLVDFAGQKIFKSATVDVNLLIIEKAKNRNATKSCVITEASCLNNLSVFIEHNQTINSFKTKQSWTILQGIEQRIKKKIEEAGIPLKDWDVSINRGILTGYNEAFIISEEKRDELITQDPKSAEIIRPILRGRDIKRYGYDFADLWLINTHNGVVNKGIQGVDVNKFPAIKTHLDNYFSELQKRYDKGDTPYNLRSCDYMDDFNKQKIVWGNLNLSASYCLAEAGMYVNAPCPMIVPANKFLLAILNSKLADYYIRSLGVTRNGGYFEYKPMFVEQLPVPKLTLEEQEPFAELATMPTRENQCEIDLLVYRLYSLSDDEIAFINDTA
ncbi:MAG: class I SAM-dependent DNA methyltransferase [Chloroflexi bacterium]|nr:MAG: class I SAM-dependent DNA methyltransferase [Chloroflexota bacterium]